MAGIVSLYVVYFQGQPVPVVDLLSKLSQVLGVEATLQEHGAVFHNLAAQKQVWVDVDQADGNIKTATVAFTSRGGLFFKSELQDVFAAITSIHKDTNARAYTLRDHGPFIQRHFPRSTRSR